MSDPQSTSALFAGGDPTVQATYERLLEALRQELLAMIAEDEQVRAELAADGSLYQGYHPRMAEVHRRNAARMTGLIGQYGWLGRHLVGDDGAAAAWRIVQHAIGDPKLQRAALPLLREAIAKGDAEPWWAAMLEDRICLFEGRPQTYGTQFDWDDDGQFGPYPPVADPDGVDARRAAVGLEPLAEKLRQMRAAMANEAAPDDLAARRQAMNAWARAVGWRA
jgi:hypothetical protein